MTYASPQTSPTPAAPSAVSGLHHVTAIAGNAQENLDFYAGILGMRLVKKSVNQDDPGTYHLFYADAEGRPGTDLTFFPWSQMAPARPGSGLASEVSLAVLPETLEFWAARLERFGAALGRLERRFGERVLPVRDPHGLGLALVESDSARSRPFTPWTESPVPPEYQILGLHGARLRERELEPTVSFLTRQMGFRQLATDGPWQRYGVLDGSSGQHVDLLAVEERAGHWGIGAVHHLAFRVDDEAHQMAIRRQVEMAVAPTPVVDRFWFKSVYFREPGGVLFELATDGPGFAVDEDPAHLGKALVLPPWLEGQRRTIAANLPPLSPPAPETFR